MPRTRAEAHTCHAQGCDVKVPPKMFMCRRHWYMVPYGLRVAIWAAYQPGQERLDGTAFPSEEYLSVTREAIEAVAEKEGGQQGSVSGTALSGVAPADRPSQDATGSLGDVVDAVTSDPESVKADQSFGADS